MSGESLGEDPNSSSHPRIRHAIVTAGFVLLCCVLAIALTAAVTAQESDDGGDSGAPPAFGNATKGNLTTIQLTITDDTDVDEGSIDAEDFTLNPGSLRGISVNESGSNADVELYLSSTVSSNTVDVSLTDDGAISDAAGNTLTDANVSVSGMDGFRPQLQDFTVTRVNESTARVRVVSSETLSELYVGVGGPGSATLEMENFTKMDTQAAFEVPYETTLTFDQDGEYDVLVGTMTDENGVTSRYNVERTFLVDRSSPTPSIGAPASAQVGETITFSAAGSSDEYGISGYNWSVDGNQTGSGETLEYAFETPGFHGVTVTVRDRRNNTATKTYPILVESDVTTDAVTVESDDARSARASVGPNRTTGRVLIAQDGGLVSTDGVRLDSLAVDVPTDANASLDFTIGENASASFGTLNTTALAGLEVAHERSLPTATFRFSVNRSRLDAVGLAPADVTLYRNADGWRSIYTMKLEERDGWVTYEATAAGLSEFAIGATGGGATDDSEDQGSTTDTNGDTTEGQASEADPSAGSPRILVSNSTLLTEAVEAGDRAVVRAVLHNDGNATGSYVVGMVVNNSAVSTATVTVPPGENRTVTFAERVDAGGTVVVNGTIAGELSVAGETSAATAGGGGGLPIPNPLALWPGGLFGRVLGAVFWFLVVSYTVLKGLALYLGY